MQSRYSAASPPSQRSRPRWALALLGGALLLIIGIIGLWGHRAAPRPVSGRELAALRAHTPPDMVLVPGGYCWLGSNDEDADEDVKPMRRVYIPSFYIDAREVTNDAYRRFDPKHTFAPGHGDLPVTNVTYDEAAAYARWAGKRLPAEEEWEKAARGPDGRRYPWGDVWDPHRVAQRANRLHSAFAHTGERMLAPPPSPAPNGKVCFLGSPRVRPVGSVPDGVSYYGAYDMAGNAWEWVAGYYNGNPDQRILRGGAVGYGERACRTYTRAIEGSGAT